MFNILDSCNQDQSTLFRNEAGAQELKEHVIPQISPEEAPSKPHKFVLAGFTGEVSTADSIIRIKYF